MSFKEAALLTLLAAIGWLWYSGELGNLMAGLTNLGNAYGNASSTRGL